MPPPKEIMRKLRWWIEKRFNKVFKELGDELTHGKQEDGTECGILTANTIAHEVFRDTLWTTGRKEVERVGWFNALTDVHIADVSKSSKIYDQYLTSLS